MPSEDLGVKEPRRFWIGCLQVAEVLRARYIDELRSRMLVRLPQVELRSLRVSHYGRSAIRARIPGTFHDRAAGSFD